VLLKIGRQIVIGVTVMWNILTRLRK
jgi:hypothetical protein